MSGQEIRIGKKRGGNEVICCRGSSTGGVLLWVLAILTMNGTGEVHQQEEKRRN